MDSGAAFHMSHTRAGMAAYKKAPVGKTVEVADGTILPVDGFGAVEVDLDQPGTTTKPVKMVAVAYMQGPGRPRSFRHQRRPVDDCSPGRREWRKTAEPGPERFMAKWIAAEKYRVGLRHAVVCPNVTGRTKDRIAQSKRVRAGSFAIVD